MDSTTKNAHTRKTTRFNLLLSFLSSPSPLPICLPFALLFLSHTSFQPTLGKNYIRIYTPDSLLSCIIRLFPKFLSSFALVRLSIFFISFPLIFFSSFFSKFVLLFSFLFPSFPLFLPFSFPFPFPFSFPFSFPSLLFHSSLIFFPSPKGAFDSFPPPWGGIIEEYAPLYPNLIKYTSPLHPHE